MPFPISINKKIVIKIDDINISSDRYLLNHIDNLLAKHGFRYIIKSDNSVLFHCIGYFDVTGLAYGVNNGWIRIKIKKDKIIIKLISFTFVFFVYLVVLVLVYFFTNPIIEDNEIAFFIGFIFGINYLIRLVSVHNLKKEIRKLIYEL